MQGALIVGLLAILMSSVVFVFQRYTQIKYGFKQKQALIKEKNELMKVIYKTKDPKDPKVSEEIDKIQKEIMEISMDMMKANFKNILWTMILGIIILSVIFKYSQSAFPVSGFWIFSPVLFWYIIVSLISNIILKIVFSVLENYKVLRGEYNL